MQHILPNRPPTPQFWGISEPRLFQAIEFGITILCPTLKLWCRVVRHEVHFNSTILRGADLSGIKLSQSLQEQNMNLNWAI
jgi:hypothetical protein